MESVIECGTASPTLVAAMTALTKRVKITAEYLGRIRRPEGPAEVQGELRKVISDIHKISKAGAALRAVVPAYAHRVNELRTVISGLARGQDTGPQSFIRLYFNTTTAIIGHLLSDFPDVETVRAGIPSLSLYDRRDRGGPVGMAAQRRIPAIGSMRGPLSTFSHSFQRGRTGYLRCVRSSLRFGPGAPRSSSLLAGARA